jgi:hypothetical protein
LKTISKNNVHSKMKKYKILGIILTKMHKSFPLKTTKLEHVFYKPSTPSPHPLPTYFNLSSFPSISLPLEIAA